MTQWTATQYPQPLPRVEMEVGPISLSVSQDKDGRRWQYVTISIGRFSQDTLESCQDTWPHEAYELIQSALAQLAEVADLQHSVTE